MKSKRSLMTVLVGLAMLATPIDGGCQGPQSFDNSRARVMFAGRDVAPVVTRMSSATRHLDAWRRRRSLVMNGANITTWNEGDANDYQNYGNRGYYAAPAICGSGVSRSGAVRYGGGYGGGGGGQGCNRAERIMRTYQRDRATGHPAAAADLLRQNQWAFRSGCAGATPYARRPVDGGLGGLGGRGPGWLRWSAGVRQLRWIQWWIQWRL